MNIGLKEVQTTLLRSSTVYKHEGCFMDTLAVLICLRGLHIDAGKNCNITMQNQGWFLSFKWKNLHVSQVQKFRDWGVEQKPPWTHMAFLQSLQSRQQQSTSTCLYRINSAHFSFQSKQWISAVSWQLDKFNIFYRIECQILPHPFLSWQRGMC